MANSSKGLPNEFSQIIFTGSLAVNKAANSTNGTGVFTHNLGYLPSYLCYFTTRDADTYWTVPFTQDVASGADAGKTYLRVNTIATTDSITCFIVTNNTPGSTYYPAAFTWDFHFYIFKQPVSPPTI